jgi:hypothetical protein
VREGLGHRDGAKRRAGVNALDPSPARKWRARGRIEHTLLDGEFSVRPNRPKTIARYHTIPQKVTNVSIYGEGPEPRG